MAYKKELWGNMPDGKEVYLYTLENGNGVSASFTDLGAVWVSMLVPDREGNKRDVVLGYDTVAQYLENPPHFGAPIGRNANRIANSINWKPIMVSTIYIAVLIFITPGCGRLKLRKQRRGLKSAFLFSHLTEIRDFLEMRPLQQHIL